MDMGTIFEIVCEAKGVPHPIITWRIPFDGEELQHRPVDNTRRHVVHVTHKEQAGRYDCIANNSVGDPAVAGILLHINCKCENSFRNVLMSKYFIYICNLIRYF